MTVKIKSNSRTELRIYAEMEVRSRNEPFPRVHRYGVFKKVWEQLTKGIFYSGYLRRGLSGAAYRRSHSASTGGLQRAVRGFGFVRRS